jgi:hypothetical protein
VATSARIVIAVPICAEGTVIDRRAVIGGAAGDRSADAFDRAICVAERVVVPLVISSADRLLAPAGRIGRRAAQRDQRGGDQRQVVPLDRYDAHAIGQPRLDRLGQDGGDRRAGAGAGCAAPRGRGHDRDVGGRVSAAVWTVGASSIGISRTLAGRSESGR